MPPQFCFSLLLSIINSIHLLILVCMLMHENRSQGTIGSWGLSSGEGLGVTHILPFFVWKELKSRMLYLRSFVSSSYLSLLLCIPEASFTCVPREDTAALNILPGLVRPKVLFFCFLPAPSLPSHWACFLFSCIAAPFPTGVCCVSF